MSTLEPDFAAPKQSVVLQTFIAPSDEYPIALSVLWMPVSDLSEQSSTHLTQHLIQKRIVSSLSLGFSHDVANFLERTISTEVALNNFNLSLVNLFLNASLTEPNVQPNYLRTAQDQKTRLLEYRRRLRQLKRCPPGNERLLQSKIVISRSPPSEETLGKLLSGGTIGVGVYSGLLIVPQEANPVLLLACVAGGIICISTAAGIGRALHDGLYKRLHDLITSSAKGKKEEHDDK